MDLRIQYLSVVFLEESNSTDVLFFQSFWGAKQIPQGSILDILIVYGLQYLQPRAHSVNQQAQPHRHTVNIACHKNVTAMVTSFFTGILGQKLPNFPSFLAPTNPAPGTNRAPLIALTALLVNAVETRLDLTAWMIKAVNMGDFFFQGVWFDNQPLSRVFVDVCCFQSYLQCFSNSTLKFAILL